MAEFNKMASVINGLAMNFQMEKEECECDIGMHV